jgi:hypothetical protein
MSNLAGLLLELFRGRRDVYGKQTRDGRIVTAHRPLTPEVIQGHLAGWHRVGVHPVLDDGTAWWGCCDFDDGSVAAPSAVREVLSRAGLPCHIERSKLKGHHVWLFFPAPRPTAEIRAILRGVLAKAGEWQAEMFPKQDALKEGGVGNFVFLPCCGIPSDTGLPRAVFLDTGRDGWPPVAAPGAYIEGIIRERDAAGSVRAVR